MQKLERVTLYGMDCRDAMGLFIAENSVDSIVTDPPYGLGFMGKAWDHGVPGVEFWRHAYEVLKPGGHLLAFSGSRTYHRMVCAIEDAGFEIRDQIMWVYGSGFPKSLDVSKAIDKAAGAEREVIGPKPGLHSRGKMDVRDGWDRPWMKDEEKRRLAEMETAPSTEAAQQWQGWGTALKPAFEPICVARKPLIGTVAANVLHWGTGALNIDACRVAGEPWKAHSATGLGAVKFFTEGDAAVIEKSPHDAGRWPANLLHDGSDEVLAAFPDAKGQQGDLTGHVKTRGNGIYGDMAPAHDAIARIETNKSAARFFYQAKTSKKDRNEGCQGVTTWENADLSHVTEALRQLQKVTSDDMTLLLADHAWNTTSCGSEQTAQFHQAIKSITETLSRSTTASTTSNCSPHSNTSACIRDAIEIAAANGSNLAELAEFTNLLKPNTTSEKTASVLSVVHAALQALSQASASAKHGNVHSTVKPTDLMAYLCRLVTPPGGVVLDPFMGSGSTGKAALREGFRFIGCELDDGYMQIAQARLAAEAWSAT